MRVEKFTETGNEVNPRESNSRTDAEPPFKACVGATCCGVRFVGFSDSAERALVKGDSCLSGSKSTSRADEETHPKSFLKAGDGFGDRRLADFHIARGQ